MRRGLGSLDGLSFDVQKVLIVIFNDRSGLSINPRSNNALITSRGFNRSQLIHSKNMVALIAFEFLFARRSGHYYKVASGLAFWALAIDCLFYHLCGLCVGTTPF